jgi:release factor glutamine methyltransferase
VNVARLLGDATVRIGAALGLERRESRIEARALAVHAWGVNAAWLIAHDIDPLTEEHIAAFRSLLSRRLGGEPVAYILGQREFFGLNFIVTPAVLIPRPETEILVEAALERIPAERPGRILDLGTGSGAVAISLARHRPMAEVVAVEASAAALAVAEANMQRLDVENLRCLRSDWYADLPVKKFDMIVANPPYVAVDDPHLSQGDVRFEPPTALTAGPTGLDDLGIIIAAAPAHLSAGGWLLVEHGWNQGTACRKFFKARGFFVVQTLRDLADRERVTLGRHPG